MLEISFKNWNLLFNVLWSVYIWHTWVTWGGAARLLTLTLLTVYADFFAAKINLKFQPKITSKNILASKKKILGEFSHVFHTVYVLYGT